MQNAQVWCSSTRCMPMADTASIHTSKRTGLAVQERAASTKLAARETPCRRTNSLLKRTQVNHHQTLRPTPASCLSQPNKHPADPPCRRAPTSDYVTGPSPKQSPCAHQVHHSPARQVAFTVQHNLQSLPPRLMPRARPFHRHTHTLTHSTSHQPTKLHKNVTPLGRSEQVYCTLVDFSTCA